MIIHDCEQRTDEWHALRIGRITGTSFVTMANGTKPGIETLCQKTAAEILTGKSSDSGFTNAAMEHGTETESDARKSYEAERFKDVQEVGFLEMDELIGVSPDGLVGDDGGVEIKCPQAHTHITYIGMKSMPTKYRWQVQGALWITGRKWWDFVSYNRDFPPMHQLLITRVAPDGKAFDKLEEGAYCCRKRISEILERVGG